MKDTICTLHPEKRQGVNISATKYEIIRKAILSVLRTQKEMTYMNLSRAQLQTATSQACVKGFLHG